MERNSLMRECKSGAEPCGRPPSGRASFSVTPETRYAYWYATSSGAFALARKKELLGRLLSGWTRRTRSLLVVQAGDGIFLENLWESGFDVTGQESVPALLGAARARLGGRADYALGAPDLLPFDSCSFDYAVAVDALEFCREPGAVLREMGRVACGGLILMVPNAWSLLGLRCLLAADHRPLLPFLQSPRRLHRLLKKTFAGQRTVWLSSLLGPVCSWRFSAPAVFANSLDSPFPLGAVAGVRIDFGPLSAGTPLLVPLRSPVSSVE
ncbi:MAG: class I SAM-dependent methyltransferase [Desulfovibrio sp.]|nr:class I SAM-dependent methyltransferase [Desulfovibrio sp.]